LLEVRQLRYFIAVAEELHFTKAADREHVAQSALSTQIKQIEAILGTRLFERKKRSLVTLTDAGVLFLREAKRARDQIELAETIGRRAGRGELGHVQIAYVASAALSGVMPKAIASYRELRNDVTLSLAQMETPKQLAAIAAGGVDAGFMRPRQIYPEGISAKVLLEERLLIACHSDRQLASRPTLKTFCNDVFIVPQFEESGGFLEYVAEFTSGARPAHDQVFKVRDFLTALSLVAAGVGVALVPESMRSMAIDNVTYTAIAGYKRTIGLSLAYRSNEKAPAIRGFIDAAVGISNSKL
jgi:DNA-binding transcriptional LysR family regulator